MNKKVTRNYDLHRILKPYENKWVALSYDRRKVLGAGDTLEEAEGKAIKKAKKFTFIKLPPYDVRYVPTIL
ncbi:MAG: hypothetical protein HY001_03425 [Candidatus Portnoybacteria bacterium]|nr:hypothetical protein [Candidatus Portnoybacteria bacterium]